MTGKKKIRSKKKVSALQTGRTAAESVASTMTPLLPIHPMDVLGVLPGLAKMAMATPARFLGELTRLSVDQLRVLAGLSDLSVPSRNPRFTDERWTSHPYYRRLAQSWVSLDQHSRQWLASEHLNAADRRRADFFLNSIVGALSPANFVVTNPEVVDKTLESRGRNLLTGMARFANDLKRNYGLPTQVDKNRFEVGKNLATTPGQVIYRTELIELIQYTPATRTVYGTPTLLVPSFINRGYIFDMKPGRSMVEYMVARGHTVFAISFFNPGKEQGHWGIDHYVEAIIDAGRAVRAISGTKTFNIAGICAGAQLAMLAAVVLEARKKRWINTVTSLVLVLDPKPEDTEPGVLCTEQTVRLAKQRVRKKGLLKAHEMTWTLNLLQPERLIFNTAVDYYLLGKDPSSSEMMYWMNDQMNVAVSMFCDELDITLYNPLPKPGRLSVLGVPIDLRRLTMDVYSLAAYYDHVMPWHSVYRNRNLLGGNTEFVLTNGGHSTPCVTPIDHPRAKYFVNSETPENHEEWLSGADEHNGSWLPHWMDWLATRSGNKVRAAKCAGSRTHKPLCEAPGTYVLI